MKLPALTGLRRVLQNQFRKAGDGYEACVLQVALGKLHAKLLLDFGNEFHHFHRSEPSGLEVVDLPQRIRFALADLRPRSAPVSKPRLDLCCQLSALFADLHFSMATQRAGEPSHPFSFSGITMSSTSDDVRALRLATYSTSTTPAPRRTLWLGESLGVPREWAGLSGDGVSMAISRTPFSTSHRAALSVRNGYSL